MVGYVLIYISFFPTLISQRRKRRQNPDSLQPEARLWWLLYTVPLLPIGLIGFAWTSLGPGYKTPWIAPMIFSTCVGGANYAIYMATIDYMIASYGPYSASATGGNGFARDFLAGIAAMYSTPFYQVIPGRFTLAWPTTVLAIIGVFVAIPVYIFYWKGPIIREKSKFALVLAADGVAAGGVGGDGAEKDGEEGSGGERLSSVDYRKRFLNANKGGQRGMSIRRRSMAPPAGLSA